MTPEQKAAMRSLARIWPGTRIYVVGATALVLGHRLPPGRVTLDIDVAVDVCLDELQSALNAEADWLPDLHNEHRWKHQQGTQVDLLPIGSEELKAGVMVWPGTGARMNLEGFQLLSDHSVPVKGLPVHAADPALIALLKIAAWLDRPQERKKDLADLGFLLDNYLDPDDDRMFIGEAATLGLFDENANTYLLGFDIGRMSGSASLVSRFISRLRTDSSSQVDLAKRWPSVEDEDALLQRLELFEAGLHRAKAPD